MAEGNINKTNWGPTILSIIIGVVVAIVTTWYTVYTNKQEAERAEKERYDNVSDNLVSIIEEHIVNKDSVDLEAFNRLITNRTKKESLYKRPSIYDLLTQAEFNVQNSKHLSFEKKLEYSKRLSTLYSFIKSDTIVDVSHIRFPEEMNKLLSTIEETKKIEGKSALKGLINKYEDELITVSKSEINEESVIEYLFKSPTKIILIIFSYSVIAIFFWYYLRLKRRRHYAYEKYLERKRYEEEKIKEEIERLTELRHSKEIDKDELQFIEERIEHLFNRLDDLEKNYRQ